jgi:alpha-L-fucosidase
MRNSAWVTVPRTSNSRRKIGIGRLPSNSAPSRTVLHEAAIHFAVQGCCAAALPIPHATNAAASSLFIPDPPNLTYQTTAPLCYRVAVKHLFYAAAVLGLAPMLTAQSGPPQDYAANIARQVAKVRAATAPAGHAAPFQATWDSLAQYRAPDWFRDAKFGIFLHWGVYSVPAFGNEWYSRNMYVPGNKAYEHHIATYGPQTAFGYKDFIPMFRAEHFDPAAWVDLFVRAGARYVVPVAEHCDGFAMYASDITPWNAAVMGPHRDAVGELAAATRARGLRFGVSSHTAEHWWWYGEGRSFPSDVREAMVNPAARSLAARLYGPAEAMNLPGPSGDVVGTAADAKEPDPSHLELWYPPDQAWLDNWLARSSELIDKYHPDFFYFDWWIGQPAYKPGLREFAAYYYDSSAKRNQQPVLTYKEESMPANTATLDIERGKLDTLRLLPWQTDTSISVHSWGYVDNDEYRTAKSLIHQLLDTVAKNGNLLLNVGPKSDGTIPDQARAVLLEMGAWLKLNGEAIYGSRPFTVFGEGPTKAPKNSTEKNSDIQTYTAQDIRFTTSHDGTVLYAAALGWPDGGSLTVHTLFRSNPYLPAPVCSVQLIGSQDAIAFTQQADGLRLTLPATPPPGDIAYVFRIATQCPSAARR